MKLAGWGRHPVAECRLQPFAADMRIEGGMIARGCGRAYGDAALNPDATIDMRRHDRFLGFDERTGMLHAQAGVTMAAILDHFVPRGWFPAVTPGTSHVTLGGCMAADVHGKNHHHAGSFGRHVEAFTLQDADGSVWRIDRAGDPERFNATMGGMGLTGIICDAWLHLIPIETAWIVEETTACTDLDASMAEFEAKANAAYAVAWIDCLARGARLGRSLLMTGEHAGPDDLPKHRRCEPLVRRKRPRRRFPVELPGFALNRASVAAFNAMYYEMGRRRAKRRLVSLDRFFYPLDAIEDWNRLYGRRGMVQYQCVLPEAASRQGLLELLELIAEIGSGSFLAVLKLMGAAGPSPLSFPMQGYTLALDFPATRRNLALLYALDAITERHGGRIYLAKDARARPASIRAGYPELARFRALRDAGTSARFHSLLSRRLEL